MMGVNSTSARGKHKHGRHKHRFILHSLGMNASFNRQFILTDFRLLDNPDFFKFISSSEYATYLVLRRFVWRSDRPHHLGLEKLYLDERLLASAIDREKISSLTGVYLDNISRHLSSLAKKEIIRRIRTGRQNIYVLGEWIDVHRDGSYRGLEWFYLDGRFGLAKSDLSPGDRSDTPISADENRPSATGQNLPKPTAFPSPNRRNREGNTETKTVAENGSRHPVRTLPDLDQPEEQTALIAEEILEALGDGRSRKFYELVAAKVPYFVIRGALSEIKNDGGNDPPKIFTNRMRRFAEEFLKSKRGKAA